MHRFLCTDAGPAGIALAAEARAADVPANRILVLEKAEAHSWIIRKYYPAAKPVLANYKGIVARCTGVLCIPDLTREETLTYLDRAIRDSGVDVHYGEEVHRIAREAGGRLRVELARAAYRARAVVIAIGIIGRPRRPSYAIPHRVKEKIPSRPSATFPESRHDALQRSAAASPVNGVGLLGTDPDARARIENRAAGLRGQMRGMREKRSNSCHEAAKPNHAGPDRHGGEGAGSTPRVTAPSATPVRAHDLESSLNAY